MSQLQGVVEVVKEVIEDVKVAKEIIQDVKEVVEVTKEIVEDIKEVVNEMTQNTEEEDRLRMSMINGLVEKIRSVDEEARTQKEKELKQEQDKLKKEIIEKYLPHINKDNVAQIMAKGIHSGQSSIVVFQETWSSECHTNSIDRHSLMDEDLSLHIEGEQNTLRDRISKIIPKEYTVTFHKSVIKEDEKKETEEEIKEGDIKVEVQSHTFEVRVTASSGCNIL